MAAGKLNGGSFFIGLGFAGFLASFYLVRKNGWLVLLNGLAWIFLWPYVGAVLWTAFDYATGRMKCDDCGHPLSRHGAAGCDVERGDQEVDGCLVAMGPCGCKGERR